MVFCDICGKEFKNTQGLRGHKHFVHTDTIVNTEHPAAQRATQQPLSSNSDTRVTTEQRLSQLENRFAKLEHYTGVRETDELEKLLGIADTPLTERVAQLTEQLSKLTEQLKSEYVSRETMETLVAELTGKSDSLQHEIAIGYSVLANNIRRNRESCKNSITKIECQSATTANELYKLSKTTKHIQESVNQLSAKLVSLEHNLSELENEVARVRNLTRRVPTGELVSIK